MTEVEVYTPHATLPDRIQYAKALADSGLLPASYRGRPANILWAIEYGDMLGLGAMAAITGIHVIEGKPTASAGLISALVRRAGHKLRVKGDNKSATCQIIRSDDPGYTFEVTWTLRKNSDGNPSAEEAGLASKGVWKNYAASMLKARAITQCARDACEEALYGIHYTPEELGAEVDEEGNVVGEIVAEPPQSAPAEPRQEPEPAGAVPEPGAATARMTETPADDPWYTPEPAQPATDDAWMNQINQDIDGITSREGGTKVWAKIVAAFNDGTCTPDDRRALEAMVAAKVSAVMSQAEATTAEPAEGNEAA
jgi:hypothetical protein